MTSKIKATNHINIILQDRDIVILEFIAKFGVVNDLHIIHTINFHDNNHDNKNKITPKNYNRIIQRLIKAGYIKKTKLIANDYNYITLEKNGEIILNVKKVKQLALPTLRHDMLVLDLYCNLQLRHPSYKFTSEHKLKQKSEIRIEDRTKVPDLLIHDDNNATIAVEMEISEKSHTILTNIILNYIYNSQITEVWYFVKSISLGNKIHAISGANCKKIRVFLLDLSAYSTRLNLLSTQAEAQDTINSLNTLDECLELALNLPYTEIINPRLNEEIVQTYPQFKFYDLKAYLNDE